MTIKRIKCPNREHYLGLMLNGWCSWCRRSVISAGEGNVWAALDRLKQLT